MIHRASTIFAPTLRALPRHVRHEGLGRLIRSGYVRTTESGTLWLTLGQRACERLKRSVVEAMQSAGAHQIQCLGGIDPLVVVGRELRSYRELPLSLFWSTEMTLLGGHLALADATSPNAERTRLDDAIRGLLERLEPCMLWAQRSLSTGKLAAAVESAHGQSEVLVCPACGHAAVPVALQLEALDLQCEEDLQPIAAVHTPACTTVAEVTDFLAIDASQLVKTLLVCVSDRVVGILVRGDHELSLSKLGAVLGRLDVAFADAQTVEAVSSAPVGFAGPVGLPQDVRLLADHSVAPLRNYVVGANQLDHHFVNVNHGRDYHLPPTADLRLAQPGDPCPKCTDRTVAVQSIQCEILAECEVGRILPEVNVSDPSGAQVAVAATLWKVHGDRIVVRLAEQMVAPPGHPWPAAVSPYDVHVLLLTPNDETVGEVAQQLVGVLADGGVDILLDDRPVSPGKKFKDADLIGIAARIIVGPRQLSNGMVEVVLPQQAQQACPIDEAATRVLEALASG